MDEVRGMHEELHGSRMLQDTVTYVIINYPFNELPNVYKMREL